MKCATCGCLDGMHFYWCEQINPKTEPDWGPFDGILTGITISCMLWFIIIMLVSI